MQLKVRVKTLNVSSVYRQRVSFWQDKLLSRRVIMFPVIPSSCLTSLHSLTLLPRIQTLTWRHQSISWRHLTLMSTISEPAATTLALFLRHEVTWMSGCIRERVLQELPCLRFCVMCQTFWCKHRVTDLWELSMQCRNRVLTSLKPEQTCHIFVPLCSDKFLITFHQIRFRKVLEKYFYTLRARFLEQKVANTFYFLLTVVFKTFFKP